jgi:hypothetical protein
MRINDGKMLQILLGPLYVISLSIFDLNKPQTPQVGRLHQVFIGAFLLLLQTAANKIHPVIFPIQ